MTQRSNTMPSNKLSERLNEILPRITTAEFLSGSGIGNEIPFYLFDYPAEHELQVRQHIQHLQTAIPRQLPDLRFEHTNLLKLMLDYIKARGNYDKWLEMEQSKGSEKALKAIKSIATAEKLAAYFAETVLEKQPQLILISGVGAAYPIIRTHELLNNLHRFTGLTPLVMFYPGVYDGTSLKLFDKASLAFDSASTDRKRKSKYYRAFRLVD